MSKHFPTSSRSISAFGAFSLLAEAYHALRVTAEPFKHCHTITNYMNILGELSELELAGLFAWTGILMTSLMAGMLLAFNVYRSHRFAVTKKVMRGKIIPLPKATQLAPSARFARQPGKSHTAKK